MPDRPDAPASAVREIVKTFRGQFFPADPAGMLHAQFDSYQDAEAVRTLTTMLQGWVAVHSVDYKNALRIWAVTGPG